MAPGANISLSSIPCAPAPTTYTLKPRHHNTPVVLSRARKLRVGQPLAKCCATRSHLSRPKDSLNVHPALEF